ncbi:hypothetical protein Tco_0889758 [Tanacetum coccineum]
MQLIQKLRDDQKWMKKVVPSSRSKATRDIISIGSFVKVLVLNHYVLVRNILGKLSKVQDEDAQNKTNIQDVECKPLRDNMADENVPAPAPTRSDDQILPFAAWQSLWEALEITPIDQAHQFVSPPSGDAIMDFVNELGYTKELHFMSRMAVNNLYQPWRAILLMINLCREEFIQAIQTFLTDKANLGIDP